MIKLARITVNPYRLEKYKSILKEKNKTRIKAN